MKGCADQDPRQQAKEMGEDVHVPQGRGSAIAVLSAGTAEEGQKSHPGADRHVERPSRPGGPAREAGRDFATGKQSQPRKERGGGTNAPMGLGHVHEGVGDIAQRAAEEDGQRARTGAEATIPKREDKNREREIRDDVDGIAMQRERGEGAPPFPGADAQVVRHARLDNPLRQRALDGVAGHHHQQRHEHGELRDAQWLQHDRPRARQLFALVRGQRGGGALAIRLQYAEHVFPALAGDPMGHIHRRHHEPALAGRRQPRIAAHLCHGAGRRFIVKNWCAQTLRCCPSMRS